MDGEFTPVDDEIRAGPFARRGLGLVPLTDPGPPSRLTGVTPGEGTGPREAGAGLDILSQALERIRDGMGPDGIKVAEGVAAGAALTAMAPAAPRGARLVVRSTSVGDSRVAFPPRPPAGSRTSPFRRSNQPSPISPVNTTVRRCFSLNDERSDDDDEGDYGEVGGDGGGGGGTGGSAGFTGFGSLGRGGGLVRCDAETLSIDGVDDLGFDNESPKPSASGSTWDRGPLGTAHAGNSLAFPPAPVLGGSTIFLGSEFRLPVSASPTHLLHASPLLTTPPMLPGLALPSLAQAGTLRTVAQRGQRVSEFSAVAANHATVRLSKRGLTPADAEDLVLALDRNTSLVLLDLSHNFISDQGCQPLGKLLSRLGTLESLSLESNSIHPVGAISLSDHLMHNTTLRTLHLGANYIGPSGIAALGPAVAMSHLTELSLRDNFLTEKGAMALAVAIRGRSGTLIDLDLSGNYIGSEGALAILPALPTSLRRLSLSKNMIGHAAADGIVTFLTGHPALLGVRLDRNKLGPAACGRILVAAAMSTVINELSMESCGATNQSVLACMPHLNTNASMHTLSLLHNELSLDGFSQYWEQLFKMNRTLVNISVSDKLLSDTITGLRLSTTL